MNQIKMFLAEYGCILLPIGEIVLFLLLLTAIHQIRKMQRQLKKVYQKVEDYITTIMEEETEPSEQIAPVKKCVVEDSPENLIDAVLQEIFP